MAFNPSIVNKDTGHCMKGDVNQDNEILRREFKKSFKPPNKTTSTFNYFNRRFGTFFNITEELYYEYKYVFKKEV